MQNTKKFLILATLMLAACTSDPFQESPDAVDQAATIAEAKICNSSENAFKGKLQNGYAFCGANAWRAEKIQSVRDLMAALREEYDNFSLKEKLFGAR